jgi:hypothetical protein
MEPDDREQKGVATQLGREERAGWDAAEETSKRTPHHRLEHVGALASVAIFETAHPI